MNIFKRPEKVSEQINFLIEFDSYNPYQDALGDVINYIKSLEEGFSKLGYIINNEE
jgi:hypothetical protein